jgi:hypothetical protein
MGSAEAVGSAGAVYGNGFGCFGGCSPVNGM